MIKECIDIMGSFWKEKNWIEEFVDWMNMRTRNNKMSPPSGLIMMWLLY